MALLELYTSKEYLANLENEESLKEGQIKTTIMAGNGIFEKRHSWLGYSIKKVNDYQTIIYPKLEEELHLINASNLPKLTKEAIIHTIKWYRDITNKTGEEAQINFYNSKGKDSIMIDGEELKLTEITGVHFWSDNLFSYTPKQSNHSAVTKVENDKIYDALNEQIGMYIETHSHNRMQAFASSTDLSNSKNDAIQLVFGQLDTDEIQMHSWVTIRDLVKEAVIQEDLVNFVELPEFTVKEDGKYYFDVSVLNNFIFEEELFDTWSNQIIKSTKKYTKYDKQVSNNIPFGQSSLWDDYDDVYSYTGYTYSNNGYTAISDKIKDAGEKTKLYLTNLYGEEYKTYFDGLVDLFVNGYNYFGYSKSKEDVEHDIFTNIEKFLEQQSATEK